MAKKRPKRVLVMSDTHTGATTGLLPKRCDYDKPLHRDRRIELKTRFWEDIEAFKPIDHIIMDGDLIYGPSERKRATDELLVVEPKNQAELVIDLINDIGVESGLIVHGTPWHVGESAIPIEKEIADTVGFEFHKTAEQHEYSNAIFHVKHKVGGSNAVNTFGNVLVNEYNAMLQNHERYDVPHKMPNIILRAHRHVFHFRGDERWSGFILPCLQAWGGVISVQMTATYYPTTGFMIFDIWQNGEFTWKANVWKMTSHKEN